MSGDGATLDLILLRGLPGAGKTGLARLIAPQAQFAADEYFIKDGIYKFDGSKHPEAHMDCLLRVKAAMERAQTPICVHNTFVEEFEIEPYADLAALYGYRLHTLIVEGRHGLKDTHNVPVQVVGYMRDKFSIDLGK